MKRILTVVAAVLILGSLAYGKDVGGKTGKFDHAEYRQTTSSGQKKAAPAVQGTIFFNSDKKTVEFLDRKGAPVLCIDCGAIKSMLYEKTSTPRYAEAVLISPLFIFTQSKKHFLTIPYTDTVGAGQFVILHLDKKNAREAIATAEAQTGEKVEQVEEK